MKKLLLILLCLPMIGAGQCTPDPQYVGGGIYPDTITGLSDAFVGQSYLQLMTIITPPDTLLLMNGLPLTATINNIDLTNVTGLPNGFTYTCIPSSCSFPGGTTKCADIYSTINPTIADIGLYPITFECIAYLTIPLLGGTTQTFITSGYSIEIIGNTPSWDCISPGNCQDPGTGNGTYASLAACQSNCIVVTPSWDCISPGNCQDPGTGNGTYASQAACQSNCIVPTWDCNNGVCNDPGTGNGTYASLAACNAACITPSWDCVGNACVDPGTGLGAYSTVAACNTACGVTPSWDCNNGVCNDPGTGSGQYSTQAACTAVCVVSAIQEHSTNKELLKVTDLLGRETKEINQLLFYIYDDGTVEKRIVIIE